MKATNKHKIEKDFKKHHLISKSDLQLIQADLLVRKYDSFDTIIKERLTIQLPIWLNNLYPILVHDIDDLSYGVLRRIRHNIKKMKAPFEPFDVDSEALQYLKRECESSLPTKINIQNNLGLTKEAFKELLEKLRNGDEALIEQVYLAHFEKCVAIVAKQTDCALHIAHDSSMEALLEIRLDLMKGRVRYGNLQSYFTTRAINKFFKKERKKKIVAIDLPEGFDFHDESDEDDLVEKEFKDIVRAAVKKLCEECSYLLRQFYFEELKMMDIAKQMNKSHQAVRKQASRCRDKLKNIIGEKFYKQFINHL